MSRPTPPLDALRLGLVGLGMALLIAGGYGLYTGHREAPARPEPVAAAGPPAGRMANGVTRALATGPLVAFVVHAEPKPLPDLAFQDGDGQPRSLSQWRGRVVLLNLWATWCAPCRKEMPELAKLQERLGSQDFEVVAVSLDRQGAEVAAPFLQKVGAQALKLYLDPSTRILNEVRAAGLPATLLIDRSGSELGRLLGPAEWASPEAVRLVEAAIGSDSQPSP